MHSTVSVLQDGRILLIGGRLSPMRLCTQVVSLRVRLKNSNQSAESTSLCQPCNGHIDEKSTRDTTTENLNLCSNSGTCSLTNNGNNGKEDENSVNINIDCDKKEECVKTEVTCEVVDSMGDIPCPRWRHSAIMCNCKGTETIVIFGGRTQSTLALGDCYTFTTSNNFWTKLATSGDLPEARHSHTASLWGKYMIIAGGLQDDLLPLNSVHLLDLESCAWTTLPCDIEPRYSHAAHVIGDYLILIGGVNYAHAPPGVAVVHLPSGQSREFSLTAPDKNQLLMLHKHTSILLDDRSIMLLGGGGNCFSFGTHLNSTPVILDISKALEFMEQTQQRTLDL